MKTIRDNGEGWYADLRPAWFRVLNWFVWLGGWTKPTWNEHGYTVRWNVRGPLGRALRARTRGERWAIFRSLCPLGFFGNTIVFQPFGFHISTRRGYFCVSWPGMGGNRWKVYFSPNATPWGATWWLVGTPTDVERAAAERAEQMTKRRAG